MDTGRGGREQGQSWGNDDDTEQFNGGKHHGFAAQGKARVNAAEPSTETSAKFENGIDSPMMAAMEISSSAGRLGAGIALMVSLIMLI